MDENQIIDTLDLLRDTSKTNQAIAITEKVLAPYNIQTFNTGSLSYSDTPESISEPTYVSNMSRKFIDEFTSLGLYKDDPVVKNLLTKNQVVSWTGIENKPITNNVNPIIFDELTRPEQKTLEFSHSHAYISNILCFSSRKKYSLALLLVEFDNFNNHSHCCDHNMDSLYSAVHLLTDYFHQIDLYPDITPAQLTPRQKECLKWVMDGKDTHSIGRILNLSEGGVKKHIRCAMQALGAENRTHAVAKALSMGLI